MARMRASGRAAPVILLMMMLNSAASPHSRIQAAEAVVNMLEHCEAGNYALGSLHGAVQWNEFRDVLNVGNDMVLKGCIARVAMQLLSKVSQQLPNLEPLEPSSCSKQHVQVNPHFLTKRYAERVICWVS